MPRRWAAVVGVPPDSRALRTAAPDDQLVEAFARETERLREEVGVDVELAVTAAATDAGADSADAGGAGAWRSSWPSLELLGALASTAERVTVEVGDTLVLTGAGWVDPYRELAAAHEPAAAAGVALGPVETGDELVRLVVHHRPSVTASTALTGVGSDATTSVSSRSRACSPTSFSNGKPRSGARDQGRTARPARRPAP